MKVKNGVYEIWHITCLKWLENGKGRGVKLI